jgi:hypothetical protein
MKIIPMKITRAVGKQVLSAKANSPHIFFAVGVVGAVGATFLACRATLKLEETLDDIHAEVREVKDVAETIRETDKEYYKDIGYVYGKSALRLGRLYGPSVVLGAISIASLTGSHVQLTRRNTALAAAFTAVSTAFEEYRVKIQEELGEERERDIYRGVREEEYEDEKGKTQTHMIVDGQPFSVYARLFEESNKNWEPSFDHNRTFLTLQQNYFNHILQVRGHVFLNEVYDKLGFERSHIGQLVGWQLDGEGDGHIDFGMFETTNIDFINGHERNIWLDFNVDGLIHQKF